MGGGGGRGGGGQRAHEQDLHFPAIIIQSTAIIYFVSSGEHAAIPTPQRVITPGEGTVFLCRVTGTVEQVQWLVNGTQLEDINQRDGIEDGFTFGTGHLSFRDIPVEYNDTTIQCIVTLTSGDIIPSNNATLLVQGKEKIT